MSKAIKYPQNLSETFADHFLPSCWEFNEDQLKVHHVFLIDGMFDVNFDFTEFRKGTIRELSKELRN